MSKIADRALVVGLQLRLNIIVEMQIREGLRESILDSGPNGCPENPQGESFLADRAQMRHKTSWTSQIHKIAKPRNYI